MTSFVDPPSKINWSFSWILYEQSINSNSCPFILIFSLFNAYISYWVSFGTYSWKYFFKSTCFYCAVIFRRNLRHLSQSYLQNLADRSESFLTQDFCMDKQKNSKWSIRIQLTGVNVVEMILQQFSNMNNNTWNLKVVFPEPISFFEGCLTSVQITLISVFICCALCHVNYESCSKTMEDELCVSELKLILKHSGDNMCDSELAVSAPCSAFRQK